MTTAVAPLTRAGIRPPTAPLFRLGPRQFMCVVAVLLLYATLYVILVSPLIDRYLRRLDVQAHEEAFGFRLGVIEQGQWSDWRIVHVTTGGRLAAAGFRPGDEPRDDNYHGSGIGRLAWALEESAAGRPACMLVWNDDFAARREVCLGPEP